MLPEEPPDHSTIARTRRLIDVEMHEAVFTWMLQRLGGGGPGQRHHPRRSLFFDCTSPERLDGLRCERIVLEGIVGGTYLDGGVCGSTLVKLTATHAPSRFSRTYVPRVGPA